LALAGFDLAVLPVLDNLSGTAPPLADITQVADDVGLANLNVWSVRAALIIAGIRLSPTAMRFLGNSLSRFLGQISFPRAFVGVGERRRPYIALLHRVGHLASSSVAALCVEA